MQKYVGLLDYSDREMQRMGQMAERRRLGKQMVESVGGRLHDIYYTLGTYDAIIIAELPDPEASALVSFKHDQELGGELETVAAYTGEEFDKMVEHLDETPSSNRPVEREATEEDEELQTFLGLLNFTENEMQQMNRMAEARGFTNRVVSAVGGRVQEVYYTLGAPDVIINAQFPDARAAAQAAFAHNQEMGGELEMVPAFGGDEFDELTEPMLEVLT